MSRFSSLISQFFPFEDLLNSSPAFSCNRGGSWQITVSDRLGQSVQALAAGPGNNVQPDWGP